MHSEGFGHMKLGSGGYWAWDPVETASLVPWLFLTAYFHTTKISETKKSLTREFMVLISFVSLVFLSASLGEASQNQFIGMPFLRLDQ